MNRKQREKFTKFFIYFLVATFLLGLLPVFFR